jgi:hypothetical protein
MVIIGIVSGALSRYSQFSSSMMQLETPIGTKLWWQMGTNPAEGRNKIIENNRDADYIWFMDDDHAVPPSTLTRLLHHNKDIVVPLCLLKEPPFHTVAFDEWWDDRGKGTPMELTEGKHGLIQVQAAGAAGMLVKKAVFDSLTSPWFELGKIHPEGMGEDTWFCRKAVHAGFQVFIDLETPIGHLRPTSVWPYRMENGEWATELRISQQVSALIDRARKRTDVDEAEPLRRQVILP